MPGPWDSNPTTAHPSLHHRVIQLALATRAMNPKHILKTVNIISSVFAIIVKIYFRLRISFLLLICY